MPELNALPDLNVFIRPPSLFSLFWASEIVSLLGVKHTVITMGFLGISGYFILFFSDSDPFASLFDL